METFGSFLEVFFVSCDRIHFFMIFNDFGGSPDLENVLKTM